jgi:hypothetical protein
MITAQKEKGSAGYQHSAAHHIKQALVRLALDAAHNPGTLFFSSAGLWREPIVWAYNCNAVVNIFWIFI